MLLDPLPALADRSPGGGVVDQRAVLVQKNDDVRVEVLEGLKGVAMFRRVDCGVDLSSGDIE